MLKTGTMGYRQSSCKSEPFPKEMRFMDEMVEKYDPVPHPRCTQAITAVCLACERFFVRKEGGRYAHRTGRTYGECIEKYWKSNHMYNWTSEGEEWNG